MPGEDTVITTVSFRRTSSCSETASRHSRIDDFGKPLVLGLTAFYVFCSFVGSGTTLWRASRCFESRGSLAYAGSYKARQFALDQTNYALLACDFVLGDGLRQVRLGPLVDEFDVD